MDDLPYIDQEYGDPSLREVVSYEISLCNIIVIYWCFFYGMLLESKIKFLKSTGFGISWWRNSAV